MPDEPVRQPFFPPLRFLQRRNRFANCFLFVILVNWPIRQALAFDTLHGKGHPFPVIEPKAGRTKGDRNAVKHGLYSAAARARRAAVAALVRFARSL